MDYKRRIKELEKRIPAGEAVIFLDKIKGRLYWKGKETTIARIRESHKAAVVLVDSIQGDFDIEQWRRDGRPWPIK